MKIGTNAFKGCSSLEEVEIPTGFSLIIESCFNISCQCKSKKVTKNHFIPGPCTINKTGKVYIYQDFYSCLTCGFSEGCCGACAKTCHLGHDLIYRGDSR